MFDYFWFQAIIPTPEGYCNILQALESAEAYDKLRTIWNGELTIWIENVIGNLSWTINVCEVKRFGCLDQKYEVNFG